jgi:hypothetical protein
MPLIEESNPITNPVLTAERGGADRLLSTGQYFSTYVGDIDYKPID